MSSLETYAVIETTLKAEWTATPIVFENEAHRLPATAAAFIYVEVYGDLYAQASIGAEPQADNLWREAGQLDLHVMVPNGTGSGYARQLAKQAVGIFRGQEIHGVRFLDAAIGHGDPGRTFANYWAMTATIDWERDE